MWHANLTRLKVHFMGRVLKIAQQWPTTGFSGFQIQRLTSRFELHRQLTYILKINEIGL